MIAAIALFLLGAAAGLFLAIRHFLRRGLPGWVAIAHGLAGAAGFSVLLLFCLREPAFMPARWALAFLILAIGLGCVNVVYHLRRIRHRSALIVAHALAALTGVGTLTYGAIVHSSASADETTPPASPPRDETPADAGIALSAATASSAREAVVAAGAAVAPSAPAESRPAPRSMGVGRIEPTISFDRGSATPADSSAADIASVAEALKADPAIRLVEVQGHADERGGDADNLALASARARAVMAALVADGVPASRLRAAGYGARCPFDPVCRRATAPGSCHEEAAWRRDRRVGFVVVESSGERFRGPLACDRPADFPAPPESASVGGAPPSGAR